MCVKSRTVAPRPAGDERDAARQPHLVSERKRADDAVPRPVTLGDPAILVPTSGA